MHQAIAKIAKMMGLTAGQAEGIPAAVTIIANEMKWPEATVVRELQLNAPLRDYVAKVMREVCND